MIRVEEVQCLSGETLERLLGLYVSAFVEQERRDVDRVVQLIEDENAMRFSAIYRDDELAGFFIWWQFSEFNFIEHFAIFKSMRNVDIGSSVMTYFAEKLSCGKPTILEIEEPKDEMSCRRAGFYQRNNHKVVSKEYKQPSYRTKGVTYNMWLMSTELIEDLTPYIRTIYSEVYDIDY